MIHGARVGGARVDTDELMVKAMTKGADVVGGMPHWKAGALPASAGNREDDQ